jgi:hypothetical protein
MKLSEKVNNLHHQVQELETQGAELNYDLLYALLEDARNFFESEGE